MTMEGPIATDAPAVPEGVRARFEKMYCEIRSRICLLDYPPGSRLSEEALAREFGVSRTPLRRVLARLESEGLVQSVHGVGTIVTDADIEELAQVFGLRTELAELVGRLDPLPPTPELMDHLRALGVRCKALRKAPDARTFAELNIAVFQTHMALTANAPLRAISERLYFRTSRIWLKSIWSSHIDLGDEVRVFDREIEDFIAALEIGDLAAAAHVNRAHISMSFTRMRRNASAG